MPRGWARQRDNFNCSSNNSHSSSNASCSSSSAIPPPPSSELCALISFAYKLGSTVHNNDSAMVGNNSDVRREAELLMSLSCSSPVQAGDEGEGHNNNISIGHQYQHCDVSKASVDRNFLSMTMDESSSSSSLSTGRITPTHSVTSISSGGSRRDTFCFTCPSLSLDNTQPGTNTSISSSNPGSMLSRTLKVDDQDAMRLSSEAMARNVIESFQKAIDWRIQSWVDSLSRVLVIKEMQLKNLVTDKGNGIKNKELYLQRLQKEQLFYSNEALLVTALGKIKGKIQVHEATTAFKVLNKVSQVDEAGSPLKKRRKGEEEDRTGLEKGEYVYDVVHILEMQCSLNIFTPAGNLRVDVNVPGKIEGTFFSGEDDEDKLTDVTIPLNTDMMASMIEKCSRIAVRVSTEALLKGEQQDGIGPTTPEVQATPKIPQAAQPSPIKTKVTPGDIAFSPLGTRTPKRKAVDDRNVSGLMVITPARNTGSSLSSFGESSDSETDTVRLQIPNNFIQSGSGILQPHASRPSSSGTNMSMNMNMNIPAPRTKLDFAARLPPKKQLLRQKMQAAALVTPLKNRAPEYIQRGKGPNLPVLVEAACAVMKKK